MRFRRPPFSPRAFASDRRGNTAAEFAIWLLVLVVPILNVVDIGFYIFQSMQVREAAQSGAQTAQTLCGYKGNTPAATNCTTLSAQLATAVGTTTLGSAVTLSTGTTINPTPAALSAPYEGWYCNNTTGGITLATGTSNWLVNGGTPSPATQPSTCAGSVPAGDYVFVTTQYTYKPLFGSLSLIRLLRTSATLSQTTAMRVN